MIKLVDITNISCKDNLFLIKCKSNSLCYEKYDFCNTFSQEINSKTLAFINILSGNATVFCEDNADFDEIKQFLKIQSVKSIFCNKTTCEKLELKPLNKGFIMKFNGERNFENILKFTVNPSFKSDYSILKQHFSMPDYNEFVADLSFRLNHNFAHIIEDDGGVIFTLWEADDTAVVSALAVDITKQNKGIGTRLLQSIIGQLINKEIYIYPNSEKVKRFYEKNGFITTDKYYFGEEF